MPHRHYLPLSTLHVYVPHSSHFVQLSARSASIPGLMHSVLMQPWPGLMQPWLVHQPMLLQPVLVQQGLLHPWLLQPGLVQPWQVLHRLFPPSSPNSPRHPSSARER